VDIFRDNRIEQKVNNVNGGSGSGDWTRVGRVCIRHRASNAIDRRAIEGAFHCAHSLEVLDFVAAWDVGVLTKFHTLGGFEEATEFLRAFGLPVCGIDSFNELAILERRYDEWWWWRNGVR
jgi:hypothetical protein